MRHLLLVCGFAALFSWPVNAQQGPEQRRQCGDRAAIIRMLADKYDEHLRWQALDGRGFLVEVFTSDGGATWTTVLTGPEMLSCFAGAGDNWRAVPVRPGQPL